MNHDPKQSVTPDQTAQDSMTTAMADHAAGRFSEAGATYAEALKADPDNARTLMLNGAVELEQGRADAACALLERAVAIDPGLAEAKAMLALVYKALGRMPEAKQTYTAALQLKPDYPQAWNGLGEVLCELGEAQQAYACFAQAFERQPDVAMNPFRLGQVAQAMGQYADALKHFETAAAIDADFEPGVTNAGMMHVAMGNYDRAVERLEQSLHLGNRSWQVLSRLGAALHGKGQAAEGIPYCEQSLVLNPDDPSTLANVALMYRQVGRLADAEAACTDALRRKPNFPTALNTLGLIHKERDNLEAAEEAFNQAVQLDPNHAHAWNNLGTCYRVKGDREAAAEAYKRALAIDAEYDAALNNLGGVYQSLNQEELAIAYFDKAVSGGSRMVQLYVNYATCLERLNRLQEIEALITRARSNGLEDSALALPLALMHQRNGDYAAARELLEGDIGFQESEYVRAFRGQLLADVCDKLGDHETAFAHMQACNDYAREAGGGDHAEWDAKRYRDRLDMMKATFTQDWVASWTPTPPMGDRPTPHFMVGFPRSGTTLLDTLLRGHPDIQVMEEIPTTLKLIQKIDADMGGYPARLAQLSADQINELRDLYVEEFINAGGVMDAGKVIIDKLPLNLVDAGLIYRLFPEAKFLLVTRHPCDCVFSCFMQQFELNDPMANFLELETAVQVYDKAFTVWDTFVDTLPLTTHRVRYEDVVEDVEAAVRPIIDFFGLDWTGQVLEHQETARQRKRINTPSYSQVSQPIYTSARGRWENYRTHLEPALPVLEPWARKFGYDI